MNFHWSDYVQAHKHTLLIMLILLSTLSIKSQCPNNIFPLNGNTGIQTIQPQRPLHIHGNSTCLEVTERLSYGNDAFPLYFGHLLLTTPGTVGNYTNCTNHGVGDVVLQSQIGQTDGGNIILVTKDTSKKVIIALKQLSGGADVERLKVFSDGKTEFNTGLWNFGLPKITLSAVTSKPTIKFYQQTGTMSGNEYGDAYPWYIQTDGNTMQFQWGHHANIGNEKVDTKIIYKVEKQSVGDVRLGINTGTNPLAMLHVTKGSVLFDGSDGLIPTFGTQGRE